MEANILIDYKKNTQNTFIIASHIIVIVSGEKKIIKQLFPKRKKSKNISCVSKKTLFKTHLIKECLGKLILKDIYVLKNLFWKFIPKIVLRKYVPKIFHLLKILFQKSHLVNSFRKFWKSYFGKSVPKLIIQKSLGKMISWKN